MPLTTPTPQPMSKAAFLASRVLGIGGLLAAVGCGIIGLAYWHQLSWPYRVALEIVPLLFFGSRADIKQLFISYARYRREWSERSKRGAGI